jgi:hypothetical protein
MLANEGNDLAVAVGSLPVLASGLMNHSETVVAVMHIGEPHQEVAGGVLAKKTTRMTLRTTDHPLVADSILPTIPQSPISREATRRTDPRAETA